MMYLILLNILCFAYISWRRFDLGLFFLFLLLPTYLIRFSLGPLPTTLLELMLWVIFLIWLIKFGPEVVKKKKGLIPKYKGLMIAVALFLLGATISVFTSIDPRSALGEWKAFYIEPILLFLMLIHTPFDYKSSKLNINKIIIALILGGLITSILSIYQHFTGWMVPWDFWQNRNTFRITAWYGFPNAVGLFLAPLVPLSIYFCFHIGSILKKNCDKHRICFFGCKLTRDKYLINISLLILSLLSIPLAFLAIIFAKSTGGLIGALAGIGLLLLFYKNTRILMIALGATVIIIILVLPADNMIKQELLLQDRSGQIRMNMWAETFEFLSDHPIQGAGLASYQTLIYPYRIDKWIEVFHHPHNLLLTMWVNLGIVGLIGFVWIIVSTFSRQICIRIYHKRKLSNIKYFAMASLFALLVTGLVDSPYIKNDLAILFWFVIAVLNIRTWKTAKSSKIHASLSKIL